MQQVFKYHKDRHLQLAKSPKAATKKETVMHPSTEQKLVFPTELA